MHHKVMTLYQVLIADFLEKDPGKITEVVG